MKTLKNIFTVMLIAISIVGVKAQEIKVILKNGESRNVAYKQYTISGRGIETDAGEILDYNVITSISTSDFEAYDKASRRAQKNGAKHIEVEYTGDQSVHLQKLEKLQKKRERAHAARGAGGILAIIGAISGDRDLYNAGMVTYGAGTIVKDINTENTLETQNQMLSELNENQNRSETQEGKYRREYGSENVDAIIALIEKDYQRAIALANAGETSKDANYRLSAMYVKAIIAVDMNNELKAEEAYQKLVVFDPEIADREQAREETEILVEELNKLRNS